MRFVQAGLMVLGVPMYVIVLSLLNIDSSDQNCDSSSSSDNPLGGFLLGVVIALGVWNLLLLIARILVILDSVRLVRARQSRRLATGVLTVKLAAIPFFVINYLALALLFMAGARLIFLAPALWGLVAFGATLTYLAMLSTSIYGWATIVQLRRDRTIGTGLVVLYALLSLAFVADIAAGIMLFGHSRRRPRLALVIVLFTAGLIVAGGGIFLGASLGFDFVDFYEGDNTPFGVPAWITAIGGGMLLVAIGVTIPLIRGMRIEASQAKAVAEVAKLPALAQV